MSSVSSALDATPLVLSTPAAARLLGVSVQMLHRDRASGVLGVPYVKIGDRVVYRVADLAAWLAGRLIYPRGCEPVKSKAVPGRPGRPGKCEQIEAARLGLTIRDYRARAQQAQGGAA